MADMILRRNEDGIDGIESDVRFSRESLHKRGLRKEWYLRREYKRLRMCFFCTFSLHNLFTIIHCKLFNSTIHQHAPVVY